MKMLHRCVFSIHHYYNFIFYSTVLLCLPIFLSKVKEYKTVVQNTELKHHHHKRKIVVCGVHLLMTNSVTSKILVSA